MSSWARGHFRKPGLLMCLVLLGACQQDKQTPVAMGQLESDRIELVAEQAEPIIARAVKEGDNVVKGQALIRLDPARAEAAVAQRIASVAESQAYVEELRAGPRQQTIDAERAQLAGAQQERVFRRTELQRMTSLKQRGLASSERADQAKAALDGAQASVDISTARVAELEAGTRPEQVARAEQALVRAQAQLQASQIDLQRMTIRSSADGIVDTLPFEVGERPAQGQVVAVVLAGPQPYARVFVPAAVRLEVVVGSSVQVAVDGLDQAIEGRVRHIESQATYTPYFALNERDRGRLSYVAKIELLDLKQRLPDGVPVQVHFDD